MERWCYTVADERKSDELQGAKGGYGYSTQIETKTLPPGRYVLRVEAQTLFTDGGKAKREVEFRVPVTSDIQTIARGDASRITGGAARSLTPTRSGGRSGRSTRAGTPCRRRSISRADGRRALPGEAADARLGTSITGARVEADVMTVQVEEHPPAADALSLRSSCLHSISCRCRGPRARCGSRSCTGTRPRSRQRGRRQPGRKPTLCPGVLVDRAGAGNRRRARLPCGAAVRRAAADRGAHESVRALPRVAGAPRPRRARLGAFLFLGLAFVMLIVSPRRFSSALVAGVAAAAWVGFWAIGLVQAFKGGVGRCLSPASTPSGGRR